MNILTFLLILFQGAAAINDSRIITTLKYSTFRVQPTVVNGKPADIIDAPFLVSLKEKRQKVDNINYKWTNLCGGSIIGAQRVLTAAHCFEGDDFYYAKRFDLLGVSAGSIYTNLIHDGTPVTTKAGQWRNVQHVRLHPHFLFPHNDIAVADVNLKWTYTLAVMPVSMARQSRDYPNDCFVVGFGRRGHETYSSGTDVLLRAQIRLFTKLQCTVIWQMDMDHYVCTDASLGDVSRGDSGGPLVCYGTAEAQIEPLLVGVVSGKNFDKTTLFTRVSAYSSWIDGKACRNTEAESLLLLMNIVIIQLLLYLVFHSCAVDV